MDSATTVICADWVLDGGTRPCGHIVNDHRTWCGLTWIGQPEERALEAVTCTKCLMHMTVSLRRQTEKLTEVASAIEARWHELLEVNERAEMEAGNG